MDARSRAQRRSEATQRLYDSSGDIATSSIARARRMMSASLRGGFAALAGAVRQKPISPASIYKITASLGELKGIPMKLGQLLSYVDSSLPDESRAALSALHTHSQPMPVARVVQILRSELGAQAAALVDSLEPRPIAAGSIGQVHRARLPDGTQVAVKVQYPGIVTAIDNDFGPASLVARMVTLVYPALGAHRFIREARARVLEECDYRAEARHHHALASKFADHPVIAIPAVHDAYSTGRVLTTSFVDGMHLDDFLASGPGQELRERHGQALFDFYVGALMQWRVLGGDPHPGNYLFCRDGRLAILDHGCTRMFDAASDRLVRVTLALEADTRAGVYDAIAELGGEALLVLRIRYGLASVLARLGIHASWRDLIIQHGIHPAGAQPTSQRFGTQPSGTQPSGTQPSGTQPSGTQPSGTQPSGAQLSSTQLSGAQPSGAQPSGTQPSGTQLSGAQLSGAQPSGTQLSGAQLSGTLSSDAAPEHLASGTQPSAAPPLPPPEPELPTLEVVLVHGGIQLIEIVREVRDLFSLGISEAKQIVDAAPRVVARTRDRSEAEALKQRLEGSGGTVEIRSGTPDRAVH